MNDRAKLTALAERYVATRAATEALATGLSDEDQVLQSMPQTSPVKWHRAHTAWFFESFVLGPAGIAPIDERYAFLFNSYYDTIGERVPRAKRGLVSRPSAREVGDYRRAVDEGVLALIDRVGDDGDGERAESLAQIIELGLNHEEQHQELILTDILHAFSEQPLHPVYRTGAVARTTASPPCRFLAFDGGLVEIGAPPSGFAFDNERPRHRVFLEPFALASRPVTVGEVKAFIAEGGYHTPTLWLAEGYATARAMGWEAPLYATCDGDGYRVFTLRGWYAPSDDTPASHLSFWEAEAVARFLGGRLPTEAEWEHAAASVDALAAGRWADDGVLVPLPVASEGLGQLFGDVWEWTRSGYEPYPGYRIAAGALGEYNGKFMAQQNVLRGGSCLTPRGHVRASYRNFWPPETRFQMSGARLARDV
ncbi:MAG: ergothioneine biosynthesis protein EgtB [Ardenticatenales bacterium]